LEINRLHVFAAFSSDALKEGIDFFVENFGKPKFSTKNQSFLRNLSPLEAAKKCKVLIINTLQVQ
jgi:hypothetical protein